MSQPSGNEAMPTNNNVRRAYMKMLETHGCPKCKGEDTYATKASVYPGDKDQTEVCICDECGHSEDKFERKMRGQ